MGTVLLDSMPPSGPMWFDSCLIRDTTAKYCGKSLVTMRQMRFFSSSAGLSSSVTENISLVSMTESNNVALHGDVTVNRDLRDRFLNSND